MAEIVGEVATLETVEQADLAEQVEIAKVKAMLETVE